MRHAYRIHTTHAMVNGRINDALLIEQPSGSKANAQDFPAHRSLDQQNAAAVSLSY